MDGGLDIREWKRYFIFVRDTIVPAPIRSVVDLENATVHRRFEDSSPLGDIDEELFGRLMLNRTKL